MKLYTSTTAVATSFPISGDIPSPSTVRNRIS